MILGVLQWEMNADVAVESECVRFLIVWTF